MRDECTLEGRPPKPLIYVRTTDKLATVVRTLFENKCSMAPILTADPGDSPGSPLPSVLHIATLSGVLSCLMRHFRASLASLPLLALPLSQLPIGTWAPEQQFLPGGGQQQQQLAAAAAGVNGGGAGSKGRRSSSTGGGEDGGGSDGGGGVIVGRSVAPLHAVTPSTPLTTALGLLLEAGVSVTLTLTLTACWSCPLELFAYHTHNHWVETTCLKLVGVVVCCSGVVTMSCGL